MIGLFFCSFNLVLACFTREEEYFFDFRTKSEKRVIIL
ncbi:hypothetical protein B4082_3268 [Bacillus cereus]|uniref:Uncharacterized protein n=1 Tax=Bacillus cereus TaxID=1396 RepID=A0A164EMC3_BACCE|nr:hypothetical protein B4082_3268 [Bacillus cereus]